MTPEEDLKRIDWSLNNARLRIQKYKRNGDVRSLAIEQYVADRLLVERLEATRQIENAKKAASNPAPAPKQRRKVFKR